MGGGVAGGWLRKGVDGRVTGVTGWKRGRNKVVQDIVVIFCCCIDRFYHSLINLHFLSSSSSSSASSLPPSSSASLPRLPFLRVTPRWAALRGCDGFSVSHFYLPGKASLVLPVLSLAMLSFPVVLVSCSSSLSYTQNTKAHIQMFLYYYFRYH